jgi:phasin family protein
MTTTATDFNSFFEFQKRAFAPYAAFGEFSVRTFESITRHGYAAAGEVLEFSIAQARAAIGATDLQQLASKQAELATDFVGKQSERSNEWFKLAASAQAEITKLAQAANEELVASVRKTA